MHNVVTISETGEILLLSNKCIGCIISDNTIMKSNIFRSIINAYNGCIIVDGKKVRMHFMQKGTLPLKVVGKNYV